MRFQFERMTEDAAAAVAGWRYPGIYSFYDFDQDPEDLAELLDPASWDLYYRVLDENKTLVGFLFLQQDGSEVEIGLGLRPDLTGQGLGLAFVEAGLAFACEKFRPAGFRLSVAAFNRRAIRVYEQAGFRETGAFMQETNGGVYPFIRMARRS